MKKCTRCHIPKEDSEYFIRYKKTGRLHSYCKECKREIDRKYYQDDLTGRSIRLRKNAIIRIKKLRKYVQDYKKSKHCIKCGDARWYVLDFHHTNSKDKNVSYLWSRQYSIKRIDEEMKKCELLCANCHREHHHLKRIRS